MSSPDSSPDEQALHEAQQTYADALRHIALNEPEAARERLRALTFEALAEPARLSAHALALQLAVTGDAFEEAMVHASAALEISEDEPLLYHLLGQAFWACGDTRTGAESVVLAAELLQKKEEANEPSALPFDAPSIYFMAGEACQHYEQFEEALSFFEHANLHAPGHETIATAIAEVQTKLEEINQLV